MTTHCHWSLPVHVIKDLSIILVATHYHWSLQAQFIQILPGTVVATQCQMSLIAEMENGTDAADAICVKYFEVG